MLKPLLLALVTGLAIAGQDEPPKLTPESITTHPESIARLALGPKGKLLYTAGADNALRAWSLATIVGAPAYARWNLKDGSAESGATGAPVQGSAMCMVFDPKGR